VHKRTRGHWYGILNAYRMVLVFVCTAGEDGIRALLKQLRSGDVNEERKAAHTVGISMPVALRSVTRTTKLSSQPELPGLRCRNVVLLTPLSDEQTKKLIGPSILVQMQAITRRQLEFLLIVIGASCLWAALANVQLRKRDAAGAGVAKKYVLISKFGLDPLTNLVVEMVKTSLLLLSENKLSQVQRAQSIPSAIPPRLLTVRPACGRRSPSHSSGIVPTASTAATSGDSSTRPGRRLS
jgi:hypothetical protein